MSEANLELINNYQLKEGTFLYSLLEEGVFSEPYFWDYYNAVIDIVRETMDKPLDRELTRIIFWTYKRIMRSFLCHFELNDIYIIKNFPEDKYIDYYERLDFMIEGYFGSFVMSERQFGDSIKNPKYPDLY
ncbi:hypothetical protein PCCS19_02200 [Paenibacillus sp. CCS19]|uniref:Imm41 family immunity protein n=1 Tax=Paenibacillus sp. CCS19 TaxID=3158387 RepID=UPI00256AB2F2|nr:Imm41 family immunity protein [Paenibacillus cellulosilyticus]GMK37167.1 hypothetical protein PCCS19_02200 [Paenibacillus cellulosilyticus]